MIVVLDLDVFDLVENNFLDVVADKKTCPITIHQYRYFLVEQLSCCYANSIDDDVEDWIDGFALMNVLFGDVGCKH